MPNTGFQRGAAEHLEYSGGTLWDGVVIADNGTITSDEVDNDVLHGCFIGVISVEDNTGACDGDVFFMVLAPDADPDGEGWESPTDDSPYVGAVIDQVQDKTQRAHFYVRGDSFPKFKVYCLNESGQELNITVNRYAISIPPAS